MRTDSLGYAFAPIPRWLIEGWIRGDISPEAFALHVLLYHRASADDLRARRPMRPMRLDEIARELRRSQDDALTKLIYREGKRGRLSYELKGTSKYGFSYVFTLFPDGQRLSGKSPAKDAPSSPAMTAPPPADSGTSSAAAADPVRQSADGESATLSANAAPLSGNATSSEPQEDTVSRESDDTPVRGLETFFENKASRRAKALGERSAVDVARAREDEPTPPSFLDEERRRADQLFYDNIPYDPRARGAYREPTE